MKQQSPAARAHRSTRTASPPPRKSRDTAPRHSVLLDHAGNIVRRLPVPRDTPFLLNLKDGHYYDAVNPTTFVQRFGTAPLPPYWFKRVPCPVRKCGAWPGWVCGNCHADPIHRARIVAALKVFGAGRTPVQP